MLQREQKQDATYLANVAGLLNLATGWYRQWYLFLRVEEEILRASRYGRPITLLRMEVDADGNDKTGAAMSLTQAVAQIAANDLRATDMPGHGMENEYFIVLPETDRAGAETVARRVASRLESFSPRLFLAIFPQEGQSLLELVARARSVDHRWRTD